MRFSLSRLLAVVALTAGGLCAAAAPSARAEGKGGLAAGAKAGGNHVMQGAGANRGGNALGGFTERELITLLRVLLDDIGRLQAGHHHHGKGNGNGKGKGNGNGNGNGKGKGNGKGNAGGKGGGVAVAPGGHAAGHVGGRVGMMPAGGGAGKGNGKK